MPRKGLEPSHLAAPEPKSGVSTNFTTWAELLILNQLGCFVQERVSKGQSSRLKWVREGHDSSIFFTP